MIIIKMKKSKFVKNVKIRTAYLVKKILVYVINAKIIYYSNKASVLISNFIYIKYNYY